MYIYEQLLRLFKDAEQVFGRIKESSHHGYPPSKTRGELKKMKQSVYQELTKQRESRRKQE